MTTPSPPWALVRARPPGRTDRVWLRFEEPLEVLETHRLDQVEPLLQAAEEATRAGRWATGFLSYEAAPAFDHVLVTRRPGPLPLAWFGIFEPPGELAHPPSPHPPEGPTSNHPSWKSALSPPAHARAIHRIRQLIEAGDTYQVNFTWRLDAPFRGDPWTFFHRFAARVPTDHAAYLDTGRHVLCSASPELFFRLEGDKITCRPMKGTLRRGRTPDEDRRRALELFDSKKNRAENLMIVDMIRNDLGRIAETGTVRVESLFDLERHETVHQLTSTVTARRAAGPAEVVRALFPCASVTGAPKVRTMEIIAELEQRPRGVYTGAVGYFAPGSHAEMTVAIRTAWIDREQGRAQYGTGGGIVWDSVAEDEYEEGLAKTLVLSAEARDFQLLETLLWTVENGYRLLDRHLDRLASSAGYFGFRHEANRAAEVLAVLSARLAAEGETRSVVRLLLGRDGALAVENRAAEPRGQPWRLALARRPVDSGDRFLFHKTTVRDVYDRARRENQDYDDVVLWNAAGELTESTRANLAVRRDGVWLTPPIESGLLAGCERRELLDRGALREAPLPVGEIATAEEVALINSVRGWIAVSEVVDPRSGDILWARTPPAAGDRNSSVEDP